MNLNSLEKKMVETYYTLIKYKHREIVPGSVPQNIQMAVYLKLLNSKEIEFLPNDVPKAISNAIAAKLRKD